MSHAALQAVHKGLHGSLDQMMTHQKNKQKKKPSPLLQVIQYHLFTAY